MPRLFIFREGIEMLFDLRDTQDFFNGRDPILDLIPPVRMRSVRIPCSIAFCAIVVDDERLRMSGRNASLSTSSS